MFNGVATVYDELIHPLVSGDHEEMEDDGILRNRSRWYLIGKTFKINRYYYTDLLKRYMDGALRFFRG